jgi:FkbM family methyltransferase
MATMSTIRLAQRAMRYRFSHDPCEIREMLRRVPTGGTAIDIGAHKGAYSWWLARGVGRGGRVVAVEPQAELADRLEKVFARTTQFGLFRGAVSDRVGSADLVIPKAGPSHGASLRGIEQGDAGRVRAVATTTIDTLAAERGLDRVDFVKCDAEGHEHAIFRGASGVLSRDLPGVLVECDKGFLPDSEDPVGALWSMFEPLGYRGWVIFRDALVPLADFEYAVHQRPDRAKHDHGHNFLFAHPSRETGA